MGFFQDAFIYLLAAVIAVTVSHRLGLGSVLGYLFAGIAIGPVLGIVAGAETETVKHFAEFGVVIMLFLIGLELEPQMIWRMRWQLLGLGGLQVVLTTATLTAAAMAVGFAWQTALVIGMTLALSSTAIVLQTLNEKGWMRSRGGQSAFSVLLFQDIAVIPMLALLPLLAVGDPIAIDPGNAADPAHHGSLLDGFPGWFQTLVIVATIAFIILTGRFLVRPAFRLIAASQMRELFTAAALLIVVSTALLMDLVGVSAALGAFLAGVVLSTSEYRHAIESDIEPFKGLLLGLFFISVGAGIDFGLLFSEFFLIIGIALGIILVKALVLLALAGIFRLPWQDTWMFGLGLAQAGEFAFVLFGFAGSSGAIAGSLVEILILAVAVTMLLTPLLFILFERYVAPRTLTETNRPADDIPEPGTVVIAGVGRVGQIIARLLMAENYKIVVLDHDPNLVERMRQTGVHSYYGDATRPDLLEAAGLGEAEVLVAALDDQDQQTALVRHVAEHFPKCRIVARAFDRHHLYELEKAGAHAIEREAFEGALMLGRRTLRELGLHPFRAEQKVRAFRRHDMQTVDVLREYWAGGVGKKYLTAVRERLDELMQVMRSDRLAGKNLPDREWTPPRGEDAER
ncbi:monovalent cation:proton antiporter-2 (CPA2) family protein [uncultured Nisaea sp.]|uniref:monovalent cation:proton antiporter-2 (CPA2) family protein n=1 Tax=uncultured Nisaea sp. TaxID=538215 RepID=UPI0030EE0EC8|tara:strand:+ start:14260 stop:16140 length:1881 start_codon:yes stop_codon:yes gene_type:complete